MDVQLAWSWDMINCTRPPERRPFIPRGQPGQFDSGSIYTARAPVQVGDRLFFYYGGWNGPHNSTKAEAAIGLATLRLDGFCSTRAGAEEGWLISRREPMAAPSVTINAKTGPQGFVAAELLDRDNRPIPGFTRADCRVFQGDSVRHVLKWKKDRFDDSHLDHDKKIRFYLKDADLYSYLPQ
jgi:hypothetical protein